jgi:hypothetical protein
MAKHRGIDCTVHQIATIILARPRHCQMPEHDCTTQIFGGVLLQQIIQSTRQITGIMMLIMN